MQSMLLCSKSGTAFIKAICPGQVITQGFLCSRAANLRDVWHRRLMPRPLGRPSPPSGTVRGQGSHTSLQQKSPQVREVTVL